MKYKRINKIWDYVSYCIIFLLAVIASKNGLQYLAGAVLTLEGIFLYIINYMRTENLVNLRGLFSGAWIVGMGLSSLQLSALQTDWENTTWLCFFCSYFFFILGCDLAEKKWKNDEGKICGEVEKNQEMARRVLHCIIGLTIVSVACFTLEAVVLGFIPLFSPEPHAYSYFHISGVHYFTISSILNPALTIIYCKLSEKISKKQIILLIIGNATAFAIPILCVSRFQMLFAVGFAAVIYLMLYKKITWKMIVGVILVVVPLYILLSFARRHDVTYLNSIFEMKNANTPIFITQPYMYIAANYDNFNCLVSQLTDFTKGIRMLFPVLALTGLKFVFPELVNYPIYTVKTELTTLTMIYDAYYDFGVIGIIVFALLLGGVSTWLSNKVATSRNPVTYMFYGQVALYFLLSFFTTWFSNPTTWFWLAMTLVMYLYVGYEKKERV